MSEFTQRFANSVDVLLEEHGDAVVLKPTSESADDLPVAHALVSGEMVEERETETGPQLVFTQFVTFSTDPDNPKYSGVQTPPRTGKLSIGGIEYEIYSVPGRNVPDGMAEVHGRRYGRVAIQRREFEGGAY